MSSDLVRVLNGAKSISGTVDALVRDDAELIGVQAIVRFENGYGASVIRNPDSYGTELAVLRFNGPDTESDYELVYDTPITSDVIGWIENGEELIKILCDIRDLKQQLTR